MPKPGKKLDIPAALQDPARWKSARWCFTINNPDDTVKDAIIEWYKDTDADMMVKYLVFSLESAPTTGTPHLQGYIESTYNTKLEIINFFNKRIGAVSKKDREEGDPTYWAHLVAARGTAAQNKAYCTKPNADWPDAAEPLDGPWEYGKPKVEVAEDNKRKRTEASKKAGARAAAAHRRQQELMLAILKRDLPPHEIRFRFFSEFTKYPSGLDKFMAITKPKVERTNMEVIVLVGPSRVHKTQWAKRYAKGAYWKGVQGDNWASYNDEQVIVLPEAPMECGVDFARFKQLCDRAAACMNAKYGDADIAATKVIILTNKQPYNWFPGTEMWDSPFDTMGRLSFVDLQTVYGRIHHLYFVKTPIDLGGFDEETQTADNPDYIPDISEFRIACSEFPYFNETPDRELSEPTNEQPIWQEALIRAIEEEMKDSEALAPKEDDEDAPAPAPNADKEVDAPKRRRMARPEDDEEDETAPGKYKSPIRDISSEEDTPAPAPRRRARSPSPTRYNPFPSPPRHTPGRHLTPLTSPRVRQLRARLAALGPINGIREFWSGEELYSLLLTKMRQTDRSGMTREEEEGSDKNHK